jgi:hypothetical protein
VNVGQGTDESPLSPKPSVNVGVTATQQECLSALAKSNTILVLLPHHSLYEGVLVHFLQSSSTGYALQMFGNDIRKLSRSSGF